MPPPARTPHRRLDPLRRVFGLVLVLLSASAAAQPEVVWESASWVPQPPGGQFQTQAGSGEDWYYSIERLSPAAPGSRPRLITAGYHTVPGGPIPACMTAASQRGHSFQIAAEYSSGGDNKRRYFSDLEGAYFRVAATSDGGFIAVGYTHSRSAIRYNPTPSLPGASRSNAGPRSQNPGECASPCSPSTTPTGRWRGDMLTA